LPNIFIPRRIYVPRRRCMVNDGLLREMLGRGRQFRRARTALIRRNECDSSDEDRD
jgi:hypothetical protein